MTPKQARGVRTLSLLVEEFSRTAPEQARKLFDELTDEEAAEVLEAHAAARAVTGERDVFTESLATRLDMGVGERDPEQVTQ